MRAADYLAKNRDKIRHYNEVKQVIDDLKEHRANLGKIWLYCTENLMNDKKLENELYLASNKDKYSYEIIDKNEKFVESEIRFNDGFDWKICTEIRKELIEITEKDETYILLYRFLLSEYAHLDESYSYTLEEYEKFAQQAERAIIFNRDNLLETLTKIENSNEKLNYLINHKTDYLNECHQWKDLPEYNYSELCENELNRLQQLQKIDKFPSKIVPKTEIYLPENLLNALQKEQLITINPLQWQKNKIALCAYFVDCYFAKSNPNDLWKTGETLFNIKNLRQTKNNYLDNKSTSGKPKNYQIIDKILEQNQ